ncbi:MAG: tyrosine--tRNA ligase [Microlunatus sp.]|nr:tyrosine--tRNA ligase [Microlunatus sp.]
MTRPDDVLARLSRTTDQLVGREQLLDRLRSGQPLRVKFGVDCTAPDLHLGHAVNLWMLRQFQDLGHVIIFLIGDTTTRIGDPTGRTTTRPTLTADQIDRNAQAFLRQATMVLHDDPERLQVRRNSEWYDTMTITDLLGELSLLTYRQLIARDMFQQRIAEGREIALHELIYPVLQGFDSVALQSDLTIVGSDQLFNETIGRQLQAQHGQPPQTVITSMITPGLDGGPKQSKSLNNYVGLAHSPRDKFGRLMTVNDELVAVWAHAYTDLPPAVVRDLGERAGRGGTAARDAKLDLAEAIVARYHGAAEAARARQEFVDVFSRGRLPDQVPVLVAPDPHPAVRDLVRLARPELTASAIRRLIVEGGVRINGAAVLDPYLCVELGSGDVLRTGRRHWFALEPRP